MPTLHCECPGDTHEPHQIGCSYAPKWKLLVFEHRREAHLVLRTPDGRKDFSAFLIKASPFIEWEDAIELARLVRNSLNRGWKEGEVSDEKKEDERKKIARWIQIQNSGAAVISKRAQA